MEPDSVAKELSLRYQKFTSEFEENNQKLELNDRDIIISCFSLLELILSMSLNNKSDERINFLPLPMCENERLSRLRNKEVDLDLGTSLPPDRSIIRSRVLTSDMKVAVRKDHPYIKDSCTLKSWEKSTHIMWSRKPSLCFDDHSSANRFYELLDDRTISYVSSSSTNMLINACYTDNVVMMPAFIAEHFRDKLPLALFDPPDDVALRYEFHVHYHSSMARNPSIERILQGIKETFQYANLASDR